MVRYLGRASRGTAFGSDLRNAGRRGRARRRFLSALPYGNHTDWMKNVLANGKATVVTRGQSYEVDQSQVIPMIEAETYFRPKE